MSTFQSSTRQTDFATSCATPGTSTPPSSFNPLRGRQTLQRGPSTGPTSSTAGFNPLRGRQTLQRSASLVDVSGYGLVSILYEADRLCNQGRDANRIDRTILFQSSTRQTDFATAGLNRLHRLCHSCFNPLRGRQTLQRGVGGSSAEGVVVFQSSTRQTDFATSVPASPKLCQLPCFNPLRGRQTLQRTMSQVRMPGHPVGFQSSTRQTDFATAVDGAASAKEARFNPLRGRQTLQPSPMRSWTAPVYSFQSSTRQTDFATLLV